MCVYSMSSVWSGIDGHVLGSCDGGQFDHAAGHTGLYLKVKTCINVAKAERAFEVAPWIRRRGSIVRKQPKHPSSPLALPQALLEGGNVATDGSTLAFAAAARSPRRRVFNHTRSCCSRQKNLARPSRNRPRLAPLGCSIHGNNRAPAEPAT